METTYLRITAITIGLGSILFLVAAFLPTSRVFVEPSPDKKFEIILDMKGMWIMSQILFGLGSILTVVGLGLFSIGLKEITQTILSFSSILLLGVGALLWSWHVTERIIDPQGFAEGTNTPYLFLIYSVLTQVGLLLLGLFLWKSFVPHWISWMLIIGSGLIFILLVIFKDMPPFVYYVLTIILAVTLLITQE
jgi:hypothetical protein